MSAHGHFLRAIKEFGLVGTWRALYKNRTLKFGTLIGTDHYGNQYFENREDYAHGAHRWVVFAGNKAWYDTDATLVDPAWHGWLHHTTDEPPTATTVGSTHKVPPPQISFGSNAIYERNLGGVVSKPYPHNSQTKPRGYALGNGMWSQYGEYGAYTQPGFPLDPRNTAGVSSQAKRRVKFSLLDTPLTLLSKNAQQSGLKIDDYLTSQSGESRRITGENGLVVGSKVEGTFAADLSQLLTPKEQELYKSGMTVDRAKFDVQKLEKIIADYSHIKTKEVKKALTTAYEKLDAAKATLVAVQAVEDKLAALEKKYDAQAQVMAQKYLEEQTKSLQ